MDKDELIRSMNARAFGDDYAARYRLIVEGMISYAQNRDAAEIKDILDASANAGLNQWDTISFIIGSLLETGKYELVESVCALAGENEPQYGVYCVFKAFVEFTRFNLNAGEALLREGMRKYLKTGQTPQFLKDNMMFILQNLFLLEGVHFPVKERFPEPPMDIVIRNGYAGSIYTCVASCDLVYFYKYAENFIKEFKNACPGVNIFLLAVNPNKNMINRTKAFDGVTLGATGYKGKWTAEFAASARFMLADKILTETGGPTIFMDIDSRFPDGTSDILSLLSRENLAVCDTGSLFPFNIISAALLCARPCEESFNFFGAVKECILSDFAREGPLWGLDQTALYRAVCIGKEKGWNISETNGLLNGRAKLPDFFVMNEDETVPLERRTGKRTNNFYRLTGFSDEGRTIYDLNRSQIYL